MKILGLIVARGGSKGIPGKNIALVGGKPMIAHSAEAAKGCKHIDRVIVSSDAQDIIDAATAAGAEAPFVRPAELAEDNTPALPVIEHAVKWMQEQEGYNPDAIVLLQATSPLRTSRHLDEALELFMASDADSLVSVVEVEHNVSPASAMVREGDEVKPFMPRDELREMRQNKPVFFARNGAVYAFRTKCLQEKHSIYGDKTICYEMSRQDSVDVDEPFDLELCNWLISKRSEG
ncbi:acylneuraminate cytidylyltransferase family protein [Pseudodesulfovibrio sp. zrk46]|uniref:acylneuraminate cytidylyltransferase family protein n=1 Tax=Pseudodesulfovibrio sp. zrk46 TaxID=2725288 RepID=UPI001449B1DD|nr:acylneuraminate cytidylyltransferase family protein [Pseudodesulfovibrio sp. zrk46]QJB56582.1 acylneuraminate cytidylyltransferase family protein [Pseudodesulfovibrio sp. zrk46]